MRPSFTSLDVRRLVFAGPLTVLLLAVLLLATTLSAPGIVSAAGPVHWEGRFEMGDALVLLEIEVTAPGEVSAWLTGVDGRRREIAIDSFELGPEEVTFRLPEIERGYAFRGRLASPGRIEGELERLPAEIPSTDLYLVPVAVRPGWPGWEPGAPRNLTEREGYDNQPRFLPDGESLLYTSMRGEQTDIYRYELESGAIRQVTDTPESEYSPTPLPGGDGFSTVRVEMDGTQRLWAFDLDGANPRLLLPEIEPVGYHAWIDAKTVALFVLGEPPTLQIADLERGEAQVVARNIGRGLYSEPGSEEVLYVHKGAEDDEWDFGVARLDSEPDRPELRQLQPRAGREDFALTDDVGGGILMGDGSKLFLGVGAGDLIVEPPEGFPGFGWHEIADFSSLGIGDITRLALSPDGSRLVFVAERPDLSSFPERIPLTLVLASPTEAPPQG